MYAILIAGSVPPPDDPLYEYTQGRPKALLEIADKPMAQWVVDALTGAQHVEGILTVGLRRDDGITSPLMEDFLADQGSFLANLVVAAEYVLEHHPDIRQVLVCGSDIPLATPQMIDRFIEQCDDPDAKIHMGTVRRELMEDRFPGSERTYVLLADGEFAAADLHVVDPRVAYTHQDLWDDLLRLRKDPLKLAWRLGVGLLVKLLLGRLSLAEARSRIERKLDLKVRHVSVNHPELAMDVDKPFQLEICRRALTGVEN
ncbi:MAG: NTP transferase domain-containing protein [Anaerolineae bacterium]